MESHADAYWKIGEIVARNREKVDPVSFDRYLNIRDESSLYKQRVSAPKLMCVQIFMKTIYVGADY